MRPAHPGESRRQYRGWQILAEHPDLTREDGREALLYAAEAVRERELALRHSA
ncbi:MAG: hypothetical protein ACRDOK_21670 [Streptosporangiaceae bacterium]